MLFFILMIKKVNEIKREVKGRIFMFLVDYKPKTVIGKKVKTRLIKTIIR